MPNTANLIVVRAGDHSLHPEWIAEPRLKNFDLLVSYYGDTPDRYREHADVYDAAKGLKWPEIDRLVRGRRELLERYAAVWFPDDDLRADTRAIARMFDLFHASRLWLAQPALRSGSYWSHFITLEQPGLSWRYTNFVEIMAPLFSAAALQRCAPTFSESASGWGLDWVWPHVLGHPGDRIGILDETTVVHTRPQGTGSHYRAAAGLGVDPLAEFHGMQQKYGHPLFGRFCIFGAVVVGSPHRDAGP
jgi:hypothetical protein